MSRPVRWMRRIQILIDEKLFLVGCQTGERRILDSSPRFHSRMSALFSDKRSLGTQKMTKKLFLVGCQTGERRI